MATPEKKFNEDGTEIIVEEVTAESQLGMSDEAFMETGPPVIAQTDDDDGTGDEAAKTPEQIAEDEAAEAAAVALAARTPEEVAADEEVARLAARTPEEIEADEAVAAEVKEKADALLAARTPEQIAEDEVKEAGAKAGEKAKPADKDKDTDDKPVDFEAAYKQLTAPFKANGRDVQVNSVEEAVTLMQMGANYNKKMQGLKPSLKLLKMLENNDLLDEKKIGYLIDLDKKDPAAINKLIKDSGVDPMDLAPDKAGDYKPTTHSVNDTELDLDAVLDDIQGTPTYNRTLDVITNKWDSASKQKVAGQPQLLRVINDQMANGIYDLINTEVEHGRMLGHLKGISDIDAYRKVGDAMQEDGRFDHVGSPPKPKPDTKPAVVLKPKEDPAIAAKRDEKRKAAGATKTAVPTTIPEAYNPLNMSDAEFNKQSAPVFPQ